MIAVAGGVKLADSLRERVASVFGRADKLKSRSIQKDTSNDS